MFEMSFLANATAAAVPVDTDVFALTKKVALTAIASFPPFAFNSSRKMKAL
jgi:hypothetical protein